MDTVGEDPPRKNERSLGRPRGKKSNPAYAQVTVYLRREVHKAAKKQLLDDGKEFSQLVDELVMEWVLKTSKSPEFH